MPGKVAVTFGRSPTGQGPGWLRCLCGPERVTRPSSGSTRPERHTVRSTRRRRTCGGGDYRSGTDSGKTLSEFRTERTVGRVPCDDHRASGPGTVRPVSPRSGCGPVPETVDGTGRRASVVLRGRRGWTRGRRNVPHPLRLSRVSDEPSVILGRSDVAWTRGVTLSSRSPGDWPKPVLFEGARPDKR